MVPKTSIIKSGDTPSFRVCLVAVFENCSAKQFLRIVFYVFRKKKLCKFLFSKKKKKTCLVELIKKNFRIKKKTYLKVIF